MDPPYYAGLNVPQHLDEPIYTDPDTSDIVHRYNFYLPNLELKYDAIIKGFNIYMHTVGDYVFIGVYA